MSRAVTSDDRVTRAVIQYRAVLARRRHVLLADLGMAADIHASGQAREARERLCDLVRDVRCRRPLLDALREEDEALSWGIATWRGRAQYRLGDRHLSSDSTIKGAVRTEMLRAAAVPAWGER